MMDYLEEQRVKRKRYKLTLTSVFLICMGLVLLIYVQTHEYVHITNCRYRGGLATRVNFFNVNCSAVISPSQTEIDVFNELILSIVVFIWSLILVTTVVNIWRW